MKRLFEIPDFEIIVFNTVVTTGEHDTMSSGDVSVNWNDLDS